LVCKSCGAQLHAHLRPAAWVAFISVVGAVALGADQFGSRIGEAFVLLPANWPLLPFFLVGGALLGLIFGLIGRWGTIYDLSNEP
jgi:hypothetical protein